MNKLFFRPDGAWLGDVIPYYENGGYYLFFLQDARAQAVKVDNTPWSLAITSDFHHFEYHDQVLPISGEDQPDNCCYTGSVMKDRSGSYRLFYTAHNNHNPAYMLDGKPVQSIMQAKSEDLIHWRKLPGRFTPESSEYEPFDWRDPFVYYNERSARYEMLLAAQRRSSGFRRGGLTLRCCSDDLLNWKIDRPLSDPGMYLTHECPDLFEWNGRWYLAYSTFTDRFLTHYRIASSAEGPWTAPPRDSWDGRCHYAAKTAGDGERRYAFGWVPTRENRSDFGGYEWGGNLVVHELTQDPDGSLKVRMPEQILGAFGPAERVAPCRFEGEGAAREGGFALYAPEGMSYAVFRDLPGHCLIEADLRCESPVRAIGIDLCAGSDLDDGYFLKIEPLHNRLVLDMWPRRPLGEWQHGLGGDIPCQIETERLLDCGGGAFHLRVIVDGDIAVVYVNDETAMSVRLYNLLGNRDWAFFAQDGRVTVENATVRRLRV